MMHRSEYLEYYWGAYMAHERRFLGLCDCIALHQSNLKACSDEIIAQLMLVCSSFEASMKAMYHYSKKRPTMADYKTSLLADPSFKCGMRVRMLEGKQLMYRVPFKAMSQGKSPSWWDAYNDVKHDRVANYTQGTFGSLLDALAGLYVVNLMHVKQIGDFWHADPGFRKTEESYDVPNDVSHLFRLEKWNTRQEVFARNSYVATAEDVREILTW